MTKKKPTREVLTSKDCRACGLCCVAPHDQEAYADITEKDMKRLGARFVRLHVIQPRIFDRFANALDGHRTLDGIIKTKNLRQKAGPLRGWHVFTCVALRGSVKHQVSCSVYEKRPSVCRDVMVPGDSNCLEVRREFNRLQATEES